MFDRRSDQFLTAAVVRLESRMRAAAPFMAERIADWIRQLAGTPSPGDYFRSPRAFPILALPWWLEQSLGRPAPDLGFHRDLAYSTISGYYHIRLVDNLMDGHATVERDLLPAAGFFHGEFQAAYQRYFPPAHPFWRTFEALWYGAADAVMVDASLPAITLDRFLAVSARKVSPAKIPVAAVCWSHDREDLIGPWFRLCDLLARCVQLSDDLFDWQADWQRRSATTYFLSEGRRRLRPGETLTAWVVREGFAWGLGLLEEWTAELAGFGKTLASPPLDRYLAQRASLLQREGGEVARGLQALAPLLDAWPE